VADLGRWDYRGVRIASLVPSSTEMLFALGLGGQTVGVTHECDFPPAAAALPRLTATAMPEGLSAGEVGAGRVGPSRGARRGARLRRRRRPGPWLVDGTELLAHLFHQDRVEPPAGIGFADVSAAILARRAL
jgi:hypothetical protein